MIKFAKRNFANVMDTAAWILGNKSTILKVGLQFKRAFDWSSILWINLLSVFGSKQLLFSVTTFNFVAIVYNIIIVLLAD